MEHSQNGRIGELVVELELTARGWHVERLDGTTFATNGDLIAIKGHARKIVQVKTNGSQHNRATFGYATNFIEKDIPFFNSKISPILIDIVVCVTFCPDYKTSIFHIWTVDEAEDFCQRHAKNGTSIQRKTAKNVLQNSPFHPRLKK